MMTCRYPLHPSNPAGARCGAPATTVRIPFRGLAPAVVCDEHADVYDRARGYCSTAEEDALAEKLGLGAWQNGGAHGP